MNKEKCQVIAWSNISTETLILLYCNEFICDYRHKKILERWGEAHSQSCRAYIQEAFTNIYSTTVLIALGYFDNYAKTLNYVSFNFKGENIEIPINDEEIEQYNGYSENWAYWTTITLSNGECYDIEVYAPYINNKIVIEGEVNVSIFEMDGDEHIDTITTNICKL